MWYMLRIISIHFCDFLKILDGTLIDKRTLMDEKCDIKIIYKDI